MNAHSYPVELACPDIYSHGPSDAGIAYMHTSDPDVVGRHLMINPLTPIVIDAVLHAMLPPRRGRVTPAFANVAAHVHSMHERSKPRNRCEI